MARKSKRELIAEMLKPLTDADGDPYPPEAFENDACREEKPQTEAKQNELVKRIDRLLAGDKNALKG